MQKNLSLVATLLLSQAFPLTPDTDTTCMCFGVFLTTGLNHNTLLAALLVYLHLIKTCLDESVFR